MKAKKFTQDSEPPNRYEKVGPQNCLFYGYGDLNMKRLRVLIGCEFSGIVRDVFRAKGHDAWSCDLLPTEKPGQHIKGDVLEILNQGWDLMIAHPPCTYLSVAGACWLKRRPERLEYMETSALFFKNLLDADIPQICIENPVIFLKAIEIIGKKYDQIIEPCQFGEPFKKRTCLWLKNLPLLQPENIVEPTTYWVNSSSNYQTGHKLINKGLHRNQKKRSVTFQGIANAMAEQWG